MAGPRSPGQEAREGGSGAHARIPVLIEALRQRDGLVLDAYWIPTEDVTDDGLGGFDAIWVAPGSPYRNPEGAIAAARTAGEQGIPVPRHLRRLPARTRRVRPRCLRAGRGSRRVPAGGPAA